MLLRGSGVIGGALRPKLPAVENIKAIHRSPTATFCTGGRAASNQSRGGSNMDSQGQQPQQEPVKTTRDVMSHSFGEGYSTRSEEEGFGGVYGGNQSISKPGEHGNHSDYDKSQGSEVKEKEKGRNQAQSSVK